MQKIILQNIPLVLHKIWYRGYSITSNFVPWDIISLHPETTAGKELVPHKFGTPMKKLILTGLDLPMN